MPFKVKYLYEVNLGYKRAEDTIFNNFTVRVIVSTPDNKIVHEKAQRLMLNWPRRTGTPIVSAMINDSRLLREVY